MAALRHPAKALIYSLACLPTRQPVTECPQRSVAVADLERSAFP
jgi:hypothetical protein